MCHLRVHSQTTQHAPGQREPQLPSTTFSSDVDRDIGVQVTEEEIVRSDANVPNTSAITNDIDDTPLWAIVLMRKLGRIHKTLIDTIEDCDRHEARQRNRRAAAHNARCITYRTPSKRFRRFWKTTPGIGASLPNSPPLRRAIPVDKVNHRVPAQFFPTNSKELATWTHEQINKPSMILDEDFGIRAGDSLRRRQLLLLGFLTRLTISHFLFESVSRNTCTVAQAQLPPLAAIVLPRAPAVAVGDPIADDNVYQAVREAVERYHYHLQFPALVTLENVVETIVRCDVILRQHSAAVNPFQNAPQWAANILRRVDTNQEATTRLRRQMRRVRRDVAELQTSRLVAEAELWNIRAAAHSVRCVEAYKVDGTLLEFRPFRKTTPGKPIARKPPPAVPAVGMNEPVPALFFPIDYEDVMGWRNDGISALSMILNNTFGIQARDPVSRRRQLLLNYLTT